MKQFGTPKRPQASDTFTDRDEPRAILRSRFGRLYERQVRGKGGLEPSLVSFYGVGGVGKTTLLNRAISEFHQSLKDETDRDFVHLALLDLNGQEMGPQLPGPALLWLLRNALQHHQITTPLFDCVYLLYWEDDHPGQSLKIPGPRARDLFGAAVEQVDELIESGGMLKGFLRLWDNGVQAKQRRRVAERWNGIHPSQWSRRERQERMGELLWMDLVNILEEKPLLRLGILIDEYERIQSSAPNEGDAQSAIADLLGNLLVNAPDDVRKRCCVVVMGREILRWEELHGAEWRPLIESHILGGLTTEDARKFLLDKVVPWFVKNGQAPIAEALRTQEKGILELTLSSTTDEWNGHLPFHLDLVIESACMDPAGFSPSQLANDPKHRSRLEDRFLGYLKGRDSNLLKALQALALAISFDRPLFEHLIREQCIVGYAAQEFLTIVGEDHSYIRPHPTIPGNHLFHGQMQTSLVNSQIRVAERKSGAAEVLRKILDYRVSAAQFESQAQCSEANWTAYLLGSQTLQSELNQLLPPEEVLDYAKKLGRSFDSRMYVRMRLPIYDWLHEFAKTKLEPDHPKTLSLVAKLANLRHSAGLFQEAKRLHQLVVEGRQRRLGSTHEDTIASMSDLARTLMNLGETDHGLELQHRVLAERRRTWSGEHRKTLIAINNLAAYLRMAGHLRQARELAEQALSIRQRVFGDQHASTNFSRATLARTLYEEGEHARAQALAQQLLEYRQARLGPEHPLTIGSMILLASTLRAQRDLSGARSLLEQAMAAKESAQVIGHPVSLKTMHELAMTVFAQGNPVEARCLLEQALAAARNQLGDQHKLTLKIVDDLALIRKPDEHTTG